MDQIRLLVRRHLTAAWRYRWTTVICAWLICGAGWAAATLIPNQYEASARLYVDADAVLTPLLKGIAIDNQVAAQVDVLQRTLLSRPNLEKLVSSTDLDLRITGPADMEQMVQGLATAIKVTPQTRNLFTITYRNTSPKLAYDVVNTILATFIESKTGNNRSEMQNAQLFLDQQIAAYERQLRATEKRRADFKAKYVDLLPSDATGTTRLETAQANVRQLEGQLQDETFRRNRLQDELAKTPPMLATETPPAARQRAAAGGGSPECVAARRALSDLQDKYTDQHPDVIAARKRLASLTASGACATNAAPDTPAATQRSLPNPVYEQMKVKLVETEVLVTSLQRQLTDATKERDRLQEIARSAPGLQAEFTNLNRDYDVLRKNYEELLARRESMRIASAADSEADKIKIQIVDPPQVPQIPVAPKRVLIISAILVAGLAGGFGLALLLSQFDQSFHTIDELRDFGLPVAGSISMSAAAASRMSQFLTAFLFSLALVLLGTVYGVLMFRLLQTAGSI